MEDREKRRRARLVQRYLLNPPMMAATWCGVVPGHALLETTGNKTGKKRMTVVGVHLDDAGGWIVAEQGRHAGYVRNIGANPSGRLRTGLKWRPCVCTVVEHDDAEARLDSFSRPSHAKAVRRFGTDLTSVRVDLSER